MTPASRGPETVAEQTRRLRHDSATSVLAALGATGTALRADLRGRRWLAATGRSLQGLGNVLVAADRWRRAPDDAARRVAMRDQVTAVVRAARDTGADPTAALAHAYRAQAVPLPERGLWTATAVGLAVQVTGRGAGAAYRRLRRRR